jgi:hypothetical protein
MDGEPAILVGSASATHGRSWENQAHHIQAINRSHSELVKFSNHDAIYFRVRDQLRDFSEAAVDVIQARFGETEGARKGSRDLYQLTDHMYRVIARAACLSERS